jgi:hypothetical protein
MSRVSMVAVACDLRLSSDVVDDRIYNYRQLTGGGAQVTAVWIAVSKS